MHDRLTSHCSPSAHVALGIGICYNDTMEPKKIISQFDGFLSKRGLRFEAVVIGGTALALLDVISRQTRDCDILDPVVPTDILAAANEFAIAMRQSGEILQDGWLNHEPASLGKLLPMDWRSDLQLVFKGQAIVLHSLGRKNLLRTKLFALCDRATDLPDCIALHPTADEIQELLPWVQAQDTNPDWPRHVVAVLGDLAARLGYGV